MNKVNNHRKSLPIEFCSDCTHLCENGAVELGYECDEGVELVEHDSSFYIPIDCPLRKYREYKDTISPIVAIKDMSAGNDSVGEMWQETKIFTSETTLAEVMEWVGTPKKRVTLTIPDEH